MKLTYSRTRSVQIINKLTAFIVQHCRKQHLVKAISLKLHKHKKRVALKIWTTQRKCIPSYSQANNVVQIEQENLVLIILLFSTRKYTECSATYVTQEIKSNVSLCVIVAASHTMAEKTISRSPVAAMF